MQDVDVVEHEHERAGAVAQPGHERGERAGQRGGAELGKRPLRCAVRCRAARERVREFVQQDARVVVALLEREPGDGPLVAVGRLGEQGGLPVAGGRLDEDDGRLGCPDALEEPRPGHGLVTAPRW